ncbi:hypothetical protein DPMN_079995 [Dreissena polymorpha]|uniref:Uncharacterized protein n=1 Tax=Dreissena polymorpha TaxID=45954 RepID=A0A9D3YT43_DREPO|nr:hypothetical protein DPMN_079995 [Dreissena polymorpha]
MHHPLTNLPTKFHNDWIINVASIMQTRFHYSHIMKNGPPSDIIGVNLLNKFHDYWTRNVASRALARKNAPPPGGYVFQPTHTIFKLFHDDRTINVLSIVLTRKNALPLGAMFFNPPESNSSKISFGRIFGLSFKKIEH